MNEHEEAIRWLRRQEHLTTAEARRRYIAAAAAWMAEFMRHCYELIEQLLAALRPVFDAITDTLRRHPQLAPKQAAPTNGPPLPGLDGRKRR